eukprot:9414256-Pyramimonas_sp.AAC.1
MARVCSACAPVRVNACSCIHARVKLNGAMGKVTQVSSGRASAARASPVPLLIRDAGGLTIPWLFIVSGSATALAGRVAREGHGHFAAPLSQAFGPKTGPQPAPEPPPHEPQQAGPEGQTNASHLVKLLGGRGTGSGTVAEVEREAAAQYVLSAPACAAARMSARTQVRDAASTRRRSRSSCKT